LGSIFFPAKELRIKKREVKMIRRILLCLCILSMPLVFVSAEEHPQRPSGHILVCERDNYPAIECSVRCYNAYTGDHVITGYTGWFPREPRNWARFAAANLVPPGSPIPCGPYCLYKYYAKKLEGSTWEYSNWSPAMPYKEPGYLEYQVLALRWLTPPPMEELFEARPEE